MRGKRAGNDSCGNCSIKYTQKQEKSITRARKMNVGLGGLRKSNA